MTKRNIDLPLLVLIGPTAVGKTDLSLAIARQYNCEIVSVDSMQVYRYMDIGTAKASLQKRAEITHHLIDIIDPDDKYDAARFARDALLAIHDIHARGKIPLLTGGTGLYLRSLFEGIFVDIPGNEEIREELKQQLRHKGHYALHKELATYDRISAKKIHHNDTQRLLRALEIFHSSGIPWSTHLHLHRERTQERRFVNVLKLALTIDRKTLYSSINRRCKLMLENGLEDEVRKLLAMGYNKNLKSLQSIGYRHMINHIDKLWSKEEMERLLARDTRRYAKRQYTWFTKIEGLYWFDIAKKKQLLQTISSWLLQKGNIER